MSAPQIKAFSKFLSLILRHQPQMIGLTLDANGWGDIAFILAKAQRHFRFKINQQLLFDVVSKNDKQRFSINDDGTKIRANQGHSIPVDLGLKPLIPPNILYHGTALTSLDIIQQQGLLPQKRQYVHLSLEYKTAVSVGKRHGKPIVLTISAEKMYNAGYKFYRSENQVWLVDFVPVEYIQFPNTF